MISINHLGIARVKWMFDLAININILIQIDRITNADDSGSIISNGVTITDDGYWIVSRLRIVVILSTDVLSGQNNL